LGASSRRDSTRASNARRWRRGRWSPRALWALGYLSLGASAAGFLVYFTLLERLGPIEISLVSYVAPLFAAISGFLFLG
jgi:drug/metabolite transporter (DMT)-like permease